MATDDTPDESSTSTDDATPEQETPMPPRSRTSEAVAPASPDEVAEAMTSADVEQKPPMWWMKSEASGEFFPAFDLGGRYDLEGVGCSVTDETPEGAPAATGPANQ